MNIADIRYIVSDFSNVTDICLSKEKTSCEKMIINHQESSIINRLAHNNRELIDEELKSQGTVNY